MLARIIVAILMPLPLGAQTIRVGTFHKPSIVVAFVRSRLFADTVMKPKMAEMQRVKDAHDQKKIDELNAWGGTHQEQVHQQLAGEKPIYDIVAALGPCFAEVAKKAHVSLVAVDLPYTEPGVETVDVTDLILDWLKSDEATRKIVHELQQQKGPLPRML